jgi:hypothetical protein
MEALYHRQVLQRALGAHISPRGVRAVTRANLGQDGPVGWIHPEYHCDNSLFKETLAYVELNRQQAARARDAAQAWAAFGRLTHAVQDFYSHSNYAALWLEQGGWVQSGEALYHGLVPETPVFLKHNLPPHDAIDALDPDVLAQPRLRSGHVYYPAEALWAVPALRGFTKTLVPKDSHAWMNLDDPRTGPLFPYSVEAAVKRTVIEYERTLALIGEEQGEAAMGAFRDQMKSLGRTKPTPSKL